MSARIARTIALGVGAGALVLAAAGPAFAADITTFPSKVSLYTNPQGTQVSSVVAALTVPAGQTCVLAGETTAGYVPARAVGKKGTVTVTQIGTECRWTVAAAKKGTAVVKLVWDANGTAVEEGRTVQSLVVKVNPQSTGKPANPGNGNKP